MKELPIKEDYVSFEVAKLLKEKGFNEKCRAYWDSRIDDLPKEYEIIRFTEEPIYQPYDNMHSIRKRCLAPTHQMAMRWFREVHKIGIFPSTYTFVNGDNKSIVYGTAIVNLTTHELMIDDIMERDAYEEAVEAALKYCLENLI